MLKKDAEVCLQRGPTKWDWNHTHHSLNLRTSSNIEKNSLTFPVLESWNRKKQPKPTKMKNKKTKAGQSGVETGNRFVGQPKIEHG